MLKVTAKIPESALKAIKKVIERKVVEVLEEVSLKTYNYILTHDYPYFSGSYISSWNINVGSPDRKFNLSDERNQYSAPNIKMQLDINNPYQTVYISNYVPHSFKVEVLGTPTHPSDGWYIAAEARNATVQSYRFY